MEDVAVLPDFPGTINMPSFDKLWMCLYARLGDLCVDPRPAVRKSAGQTLFSTISAHGNLLKQPTWQAVLWQVLFPLLGKVRTLLNQASSEKVDTGNLKFQILLIKSNCICFFLFTLFTTTTQV